MTKNYIFVCGGIGCRALESEQLKKNLQREIILQGLSEEVQLVTTGCFGFCEKGPLVKISPDNTFYVQVAPEDAGELIYQHFIQKQKLERLLYIHPETQQRVTEAGDMDFYKKQFRIALRNCGFIDPENIEEYIARDGYAALAKCLTEMTPDSVIDAVKQSGLRGRGGGGFSTGLKWEITKKSAGNQKYVVCNADEGDPGAFMDRSLLEGDPHSIIEAMTICGYSIGADKGLIYIRAEYPLAIKRLQKALQQAEDAGLLGKNILGTKFNFSIDIRLGAGAFVCGEETALIHSMEGCRGEPTYKPPFPSVEGYLGKPTNVNNVETFANIPVIINKGADWFSNIGTEKSKGTKVFALAGKINNVGLIEVPMGTTLREIIFDIGGGIKDGKKFKAVQTGGPSGGCLGEQFLDTPIDYDNLIEAGSMMGSGGMIVLDEDDCMVSIAKFYLEFTLHESCGKCAPCRIGNKRLHELLDKITKGEGEKEDLKKLRALGTVIKETSLCGLGQSSPNPVLSTMQNFYDEYKAHVFEKTCPAKQCKDLITFTIVEENCTGCTLCFRNCPVEAITGEKGKVHKIHQDLCIRCGICYSKCKFDAILVE